MKQLEKCTLIQDVSIATTIVLQINKQKLSTKYSIMKQFVILALMISLSTGESGYNSVYNYRGPPAPLSSDGKVIDTAEVARARAAHLAAYAAAAARVANNPTQKWRDVYDVNTEENDGDESTTQYKPLMDGIGHRNIYRGPLAPLDEDGQVIDTPEVANAKAAHLAAHAAQIHATSTTSWDYDQPDDVYTIPANIDYTSYHLPTVYRGPPAPLAPDGSVIDTPEVAQARIDHLRAHAHAAAIAAAISAQEKHHDNCHH